MKSHIPGEDKFYQCPGCQLKICSLSKLLRHDRKFHTGFKDYECKICEAEVTDIAVHMRVSLSKNQKINKKFLLILYFFYGLSFFFFLNCSLKNSKVCKILICNYASQIFFFFVSFAGSPNRKAIYLPRLQIAIPSQKFTGSPSFPTFRRKTISVPKLRIRFHFN